MELYRKNYVSKKVATEGVWVEKDGSKFKIGFADSVVNPVYGAYMEKLRADGVFEDMKGKGNMANRAVLLRIFIDTLLHDWKDVPDRNHQRQSFSKANAKQTFEDLPHVLDYLRLQSQNKELFLAESHVGNSKGM